MREDLRKSYLFSKMSLREWIFYIQCVKRFIEILNLITVFSYVALYIWARNSWNIVFSFKRECRFHHSLIQINDQLTLKTQVRNPKSGIIRCKVGDFGLSRFSQTQTSSVQKNSLLSASSEKVSSKSSETLSQYDQLKSQSSQSSTATENLNTIFSRTYTSGLGTPGMVFISFFTHAYTTHIHHIQSTWHLSCAEAFHWV